MAVAKQTLIDIKPVEICSVEIELVGITPLISHKWSEKVKKEMLDKQMKVTKTKAKESKNPVGDFISSLYWIDGEPTDLTEQGFEKAINQGARFGFPVTGIKQASISAAYRSGMTKDKVSVQGAFFLKGGAEDSSMAVIDCDTPVMREDMVRISGGVADIRFRGEMRNWSTKLILEYNLNGQYTLEQIINMINLGGFSCGIGEWRTEKGGQYGQYKVKVS